MAITGFSSLIIIFRGNTNPWHDLDYIHFGFILAWSIGCIFLALLPILLTEFQVPLNQAARYALFMQAAYIVAVGGILTRAQNRVSKREQGVAPPRVPRVVMTTLVIITLILCLVAGLGLLPGAIHAWHALAIVLLLIIATANLGIFVVDSMTKATTDKSGLE